MRPVSSLAAVIGTNILEHEVGLRKEKSVAKSRDCLSAGRTFYMTPQEIIQQSIQARKGPDQFDTLLLDPLLGLHSQFNSTGSMSLATTVVYDPNEPMAGP